MNNEMILNAREEKMNVVMNQMAAAVRRPLSMLTDYYSGVLNKKLSIKQTLSLLNAQCAFIFTVFSGCSLMLRALLLTWLVASLLKCKRIMSSDADV